ncbi:hypothetical protein EON63_06630 [archaeon]|nr:MAG: hypothetical protein EON63_06630 [archaeon]
MIHYIPWFIHHTNAPQYYTISPKPTTPSQPYQIRLIAEDVQGLNVVTNFHGLDMTRDKLCSLIRKWQTMIEADVEVSGVYIHHTPCIIYHTPYSVNIITPPH